jgi:hypothetical protein
MRFPTFATRATISRAGSLALLVIAAAALAGCETAGPGPAAQAAKPEPPMTHSRAATECWMSTEKGRAGQSLDQRADIVTKCIDEKMKAAQAAPKA